MIGVLLNILLFAGKYIVGKLSGSVSIIADAFNNLTDAGTVCLSAFGVQVASLGSGKNHPEGHGRFEWIIALLTSLSVILVGWELLKESLQSIQNPADTVFSWITVVVLLVSIAVKVFLYFYNMRKSKSKNLLSLKAIAIDSISDAFSTTAVLLALLLNFWFGWQVDGWFGLAVSLLIIYNGFSSFSDSLSRLMGQAPSEDQMNEFMETVKSFFESDVPIYDVEIIDRGYGRFNVSCHLISTPKVDIVELVRSVPLIEETLKEKFGYSSVIQVEEAVEEATQAELIKTAELSIKNSGFPCKLSEARIVKTTRGQLQFIATAIISWMTKPQRKLFNQFIATKTSFGLGEDISTQIRVRLGGPSVRRNLH